MVDGAKRRKLETAIFTVGEVINALITTLKDVPYDFDYDDVIFKYHIDVGLMVKLKSKQIPDFPIGTNWLSDGSGYDWLVNAIDRDSGIYEVVFILEEEI